MAPSPLSIVPLPDELCKSSQIRAEVVLPSAMRYLSLENLTEQEKATLRDGLYQHGVLVIRNQNGIHPGVMPNPRATQIGIISKGRFKNVEGSLNLDLKHVPYRWHMDMLLNGNLPGYVTTIHCVQAPDLPDQKIKFPDQDMPIPAAATAFLSGARAFELLTPEEKEFTLNTTILYAPQAYEWMRECKATEDGMTIAKVGKERPLKELHDNLSYPMVWENHGNGKPHLQILGCCNTDLYSVRKTCHRLLSHIYAPKNIYAHRWADGDFIIFHNCGCLHSITGTLMGPTNGDDKERRLLWQCNMMSGTPPQLFRA
ncbi:alpha-ketoglutarate dependent xanthine dioxygenase [Phyllosticta citriasiana]|uniref:alpha-ketoglutarate dependent xanthine dioxygenase n=1 Tax=Phyllosticta citriasiana TaxID=595635 RepID=UPI0030FD816C